MAVNLSSKGGAVKLIFDARFRVPGERMEGVVEIDYPQARIDTIDSVEIKLTGVMSTRYKDDDNDYRSSEPIVSSRTVLWRQDSYPEPGIHIIRCPFHFDIPENAPASLFIGTARKHANISYALEVLAHRPGVFQRRRRVGQVFPVQLLAQEASLVDIQRLKDGWLGSWTIHETKKQIRRGLIGAYSIVHVQLILPNITSLPTGVPIPVSIIVTTCTKPMRKPATMPSFTHEDKAEGFPVPATDPKHIHFQLNTASQIAAGRKRKHYGIMAPVHGFRGLGNSLNFREGGRISDAKSKPARSTLEELIWLSESCNGGDNEHGRWQRRVRFDSDIELACCPTFQTDLMDIQYQLHIQLPFVGIGNNLQWNIPIHVSSGTNLSHHWMTLPPSNTSDFPPTYFSGEHHTWDADHRDKL